MQRQVGLSLYNFMVYNGKYFKLVFPIKFEIVFYFDKDLFYEIVVSIKEQFS